MEVKQKECFDTGCHGERRDVKGREFLRYELERKSWPRWVIGEGQVSILGIEYIMMEAQRRTWNCTSNLELRSIRRLREQLRDKEEQSNCREMISRDTNTLEFYKITPKEELPKFLQKMQFQTLHLKQKDISSSIKVFRKENRRPQEERTRKQLRQQGHIMLLSEIYQHLGEGGEEKGAGLSKQPTEHEGDLEEWEKLRKEDKFNQTKMLRRPKKATVEKSKNSERHSRSFLEGEDYKAEVERALEIIEMTHASEYNMLTRFALVENSSKLLKEELDGRKAQVEAEIKGKNQALFEARTHYHACFEEKDRLRMEERHHEEEAAREGSNKPSHKSLSEIRRERLGDPKAARKAQGEAVEAQIIQVKRHIEELEEAIVRLEDQLRKIAQAEKLYYRLSLRNGQDVRESGLVWLVKLLDVKQQDVGLTDFPQYLDRRCRQFLVQRAAGEDEADNLLDQKRKFVNEIGRARSEVRIKKGQGQAPGRRASRGSNARELYPVTSDKTAEGELTEDVPRKYRRSLKKMTVLQEEYNRNTSLLEQLWERERSRVVEISADLEGLNNKEIYTQIGERIKRIDLSKLRKDKLGAKKLKMIEYQSLLEKIKAVHIRLEDMDLQLETHLLAHYRAHRDLFFRQAAACFGYKRAHSMIIKHFSWKAYSDHHRHDHRPDPAPRHDQAH